ncbi:hypothetical protein KJ866_00700 [Patescibacteria group bacterium]|nr:hypothetical protein [Patescibacteria group bacterium]MBU2220050.1 hypothetical protein [Patescibacteria group bacterium]
MEICVNGRRVRLKVNNSTKGGEADVYLTADKAVKIFKAPSHPDYADSPHEQKSAESRIKEHQVKLRKFPLNLPERVIVPQEFVTEGVGGQIIGFTMKLVENAEMLIRYSDLAFRQAISHGDVQEIFLDMHLTISRLGGRGVVIGDFNDLNVLVSRTKAYFIDADSYQFGQFLCRMFNVRFVDPLLCTVKNGELDLMRLHSRDSDWYAFAAMLLRSFLLVDIYGGVYRPKVPGKIKESERPMRRITVFHSDVRYPKPVLPYRGILPDDLMQYFYQVFEKDRRGEFPRLLLENLRWAKCANCGTEHARGVCPNCAQAAPAAIKEMVTIRGKVIATRIFRTDGDIVFAAFQQGKMRWLEYRETKFFRENGQSVLTGKLDPLVRYRLNGDATLLGKGKQVVDISPSGQINKIEVDSFMSLPMFDANGRHSYWLAGGQLMRDGKFGPQHIGNVLAGQTLFWAGEKFGFGFYRAGRISVAFVFDADRPGVNDSVNLDLGAGQLIDSTCFFSQERCWFFMTSEEGGRMIKRCFLISRDGQVLASAKEWQAKAEEWLAQIRGKCAVGNFLFAATDEGIVRLEVVNDKIQKTREFPDTEPFVHSGAHLFPGAGLLYAVSRREITTLKIT